MSFKVEIGDIEKNISDRLNKSVEISIDNDLVEMIVEQVRKRTRLGFGVDDMGNQVKLKPLSESYRQQRRGNIAFYTDENGVVIPYEPLAPPIISPRTTPAKSNLTMTGQLLDSLKGEVNNNQIVIKPTGIRNDGYTNREIAEFVEEQGRQFLGLTRGEKNELIRELKNRVLKQL